MIDPADKQTQALPLEQPKRGRGRPATGKALSDAERARRYRANKKNRNAQPSRKETPSIPADGVKEILDGWQRKRARPGTATNYRAGSRISVTRHEKKKKPRPRPGRSRDAAEAASGRTWPQVWTEKKPAGNWIE
ncbi:hypothetical protein [Pseudomonas aeruginosa]|uniref:hypothetical protein n=1 Tax=Pseudomonas aeruginosa TaxID=287 RepID=UPI000F62A473|nr:hypothetical protein [Pseudomonas aeruginosa]